MISDKAFHAAARFGLGGNRRDLQGIGSNPIEWAVAQVESKASVVIDHMQDSRTLTIAQQTFLESLGKLKRSDNNFNVRDAEAHRKAYRQQVRDSVIDQLSRRFTYAVTTEQPVKERFAQFWSNHFTVSRANKPQLAAICPTLENEAIRPNLDRHFTDMLLRVASHPAMLMYLDNFRSVGPNSLAGKRRHLGINENFARELMELHTLGVDGGYTQTDVRSLAKILTGWSVGNRRLLRFGARPGEFFYAPLMHEPGPQTLLGKTYHQAGRDQGIAAITDLSMNHATARHLATKLVRHFVSDNPDQRDIEVVANTFIKSNGHLPTVHRAVVSLDSGWQGDLKKLKTPYELLVSVWRGLELPTDHLQPVMGALRALNDLPFSAPSPAGWPDSAEYWGAPAVIKERVEWGIAAGRKLGNRIDPIQAATIMVSPNAKALIASIHRAESPAQGMSLLLASPDFQWR